MHVAMIKIIDKNNCMRDACVNAVQNKLLSVRLYFNFGAYRRWIGQFYLDNIVFDLV